MRRGACALALLAAAAVGACGGDRGRSARALSGLEFLLAGGDSTYWNSAGIDGARVRAAPLLLARWDGRLYEVYAADDDRSFYDAVFTSQRVYRRDLLAGDSLVVFDDPRVRTLADRYAVANPYERPLAPEEDAAEEPGTVATSEVALLDVYGPYLTVEHRADVESRGDAHEHQLRRSVVDLRTGVRASVAQLFGDRAAATLTETGRRRLASAIDSVRGLAGDEDRATAEPALRALRTLRFDPASFGLTALDGAPAVTFVALGQDAEGRAVSLALAPIAVPAPAWWRRDVAATLPRWRPDSSEARFTLDRAVTLLAQPADGATRLALRVPGVRGPVRLGDVGGPVHQLLPLARGALSDSARRALRRAFDESAFYGDVTTSVAWRPEQAPPRLRAARRVHAAPRAVHPRGR
ncbi:MAG: hypothetical protein ACXW05_10400 [Gemmatirosa sp.]